MIKKLHILPLLFLFTFLTGGLLFSSQETSAAKAKTKGKCGKHATWKLNKKANTLTISGKGTITKVIPVMGYTDDDLCPNPHIYRIIIKKGITGICTPAPFMYAGNTTTLILPSTLKRIEANAFGYLENLKTITIPKNVTKIASGAFFNMNSLKKITVAKKNKKFQSVGGVLFTKNKKSLIAYPQAKKPKKGSYQIPSSVREIKPLAFAKNKKIQKVILPKSLTTLGGGAFWECKKLNSVNLKASSKIKKLPDYNGKKSLISNLYTYYSNDRFWHYPVPNLYDSCWYLGTFEGTAITSLTLPDQVTKISTFCINETKLRKLTLGKYYSGKINIYTNAGEWNNIVSTYTLNYSMPFSDMEKFLYLFSLETLQTVSVSKYNKTYTSQNGILYSRDHTTLYCVPQKIKLSKLSLNNKVTKIGDLACYKTTIPYIQIPDSVKEFGCYSFFLAEINQFIKNGSTYKIDWRAFGETKMEQCTFNGTISNIENSAFDLVQITCFTVNGTVSLIEEEAFYSVTINTYQINGTILLIKERAFCSATINTLQVTGTINSTDTTAFGFADFGKAKISHFTVNGAPYTPTYEPNYLDWLNRKKT